MKRTLCIAGAGALAGAASADILWDQQPVSTNTGVRNQIIGFSGFDQYLVNDATFASDVVVDSMTVYFVDNPGLAAIGAGGTGQFSVFPVNGIVPDDLDDPTVAPFVSITFADEGNGIVSGTVTGLNLALGAGSYWFNLTPTIDFNSFGEGVAAYSPGNIGQASAGWDADIGQFIGWTTPFTPVSDEMAFTLEGTVVPAPASVSFLALGALAARRRR